MSEESTKIDKEPQLSNPMLLASLVGKLRIMDREINRHSARSEKLIGITATELLFLQLTCMEPGSRLSHIASKMSIHQATSSNVKRGLLKAGLIEERPFAGDLRVVLLHPTPAGFEVAAKAVKGLTSPLRTAGESLTNEQLMTLNSLLGIITERIEKIYEEEDAE